LCEHIRAVSERTASQRSAVPAPQDASPILLPTTLPLHVQLTQCSTI